MARSREQESETLYLLLGHLRKNHELNYVLKIRPEEDKSEPGTYDFLCIDESSENSDLAVEITTFMESSCRKAFDRAIGEIASKLVAKLSGRLPGEFELQIPGPARKDTVALNESDNLFISSEKVRYGYIGKKKVKFVDDLANRIEEIAQEPYFLVGEQHMIHQPIVCDLIKRSNNGNLLTVLYDYFDPSPSMPRNMAADGFQIYMSRSTKRILEKKNRQLQAPKSLNKTTALIL